jgi:ABC-type multidrug transport system ATPase subunit
MGEAISSVTLHRVGRVFSGTAALRGVSGCFERGRAHVIVGPNGSGKTTLLRVMSTLLDPSFGHVSYEGVPTSRAREFLGLVSHESLVYPDLTAEENLRLGAGLHGLGAEAVDRASLRFDLRGLLSRCVRTMSRGQRQRVALARSLVHEPSLLLLDEPTTGLDKDGLASLLRVVGEEVSAGRVIAVVTHDPEQFSSVPTRLWRLSRGQWAE